MEPEAMAIRKIVIRMLLPPVCCPNLKKGIEI